MYLGSWEATKEALGQNSIASQHAAKVFLKSQSAASCVHRLEPIVFFCREPSGFQGGVGLLKSKTGAWIGVEAKKPVETVESEEERWAEDRLLSSSGGGGGGGCCSTG